MDILNISRASPSVFQGQSQEGVKLPIKTAAPQVQPQEVKIPENAEQAQFEVVQKAAETVKRTYFAVSDVRFTIFKDVAGDYVTRFTSLKDGTVKYFPQKSLFELAEIRQSESARYQTEA